VETPRWASHLSDPHAASRELEGKRLMAEDVNLTATADCTVVLIDHSAFNCSKIAEQTKLIVDRLFAIRDPIVVQRGEFRWDAMANFR